MQVGYPTTALIQPDEVAARGANVINLHQVCVCHHICNHICSHIENHIEKPHL